MSKPDGKTWSVGLGMIIIIIYIPEAVDTEHLQTRKCSFRDYLLNVDTLTERN